ncbi:MAG: hypothetical protein ACJ8CR_02695 [Roseiflexaceae bacterium]
MLRRMIALALTFLLLCCGGPAATPTLPTARIALATVPPTHAARPPAATTTSTADPGTAATEAPPLPTVAPTTPQEQYRAWMAEARALHPYPEPIETMWAVMICESTGNPGLVAGDYHGLFQYNSATWAGDWNLYRDQPILDPRAQIFATAQAWHDGHQHWWGCYGASALR